MFGRPFMAWPQRVVADNDDELALLVRPGVRGFSPEPWVRALRDGEPAVRDELLQAYARRDWRLAEWTWQRNTRLALLYPDRYYAIDPMWDERGTLFCWYVNFQVPYQRTAIGVDTCDLHLDLLVDPDLRFRWKDEDEYAQARRLGLVPDDCHKRVEEAREQVVGLIEQGGGPFTGPWAGWSPDPAWPLPVLPGDALIAPPAAQLCDLPQ